VALTATGDPDQLASLRQALDNPVAIPGDSPGAGPTAPTVAAGSPPTTTATTPPTTTSTEPVTAAAPVVDAKRLSVVKVLTREEQRAVIAEAKEPATKVVKALGKVAARIADNRAIMDVVDHDAEAIAEAVLDVVATFDIGPALAKLMDERWVLIAVAVGTIGTTVYRATEAEPIPYKQLPATPATDHAEHDPSEPHGGAA